MGKVKHLQTKIETLFGIEDEEGNIVKRILIKSDDSREIDPLRINRLNEDDFSAALDVLKRVKGDIEKQCQTQS